MKKRILAAAVCAAAALSLTGCGNKETPAPAVTSTSSTSSKVETISSAPKSSLPEESKPEESSAPQQPAAKEDDYGLNVTTYRDGTTSIIITYKGSDENVVYPTEVRGTPITFVDGFTNNIDIKSITIPDGMESISVDAFSDCLNLEEVKFLGEAPDFSLSSFYNTPWLEKIMAENTNSDFIIINNALVQADKEKIEGDVIVPDGITRICRSAFEGCDKITRVTIPKSVTAIGSSAFKKCGGITEVIMSDSVTEIGDSAFFDCEKLSSIKLSANITEIEDHTFYNCRSLKSVDIPEGVTALGVNAFNCCNATVNLPDSLLLYNASDIHTAIFKGISYELYSWEDKKAFNSALYRNAVDKEFGDREFIITGNVLNKVNPYTTKIELPNNIKEIEDDAFKDCEKELIITYKGKNYNLSNVEKLKEAMKDN